MNTVSTPNANILNKSARSHACVPLRKKNYIMHELLIYATDSAHFLQTKLILI
jgi:hypothetical protein